MMLTLHKLYIDGFLSYDRAEINLEEQGITSISGNTGAGKSTVLEAISYLLFGETIRKKSSVNDLANKVLNNGYEIELDFRVDSTHYTVKEIRGRANADLYFVSNGKDLRGKTSPETRKKILAAIGISGDEFRSLAMLGQRQSQILVEGTSTDRANLISNIFGLDKYEEYIDKCDKDITEKMKEQKGLSEKITQGKLDLEALEKSLVVEPAKEVNADEIKEVADKIEETEGKLEKLNAKYAEAKEEIGKSKAVEKQKEARFKLEKDITKLEAEIANCNKELCESCAEKNLDKCVKLLKSFEKQEAVVSDGIKTITKQVKDVEQGGNLCPVSGKDCPSNVPVEFKDSRLAELNKTLIEKKTELDKVNKEVEAYSAKKQELELLDNLSKKRETLDSYGDTQVPDVAETEAMAKKYKDALDKGNMVLKELQAKKESFNNQKSLIEQQKKFEKQSREAIESKKQSIQKDESAHSENSVELQYLSAALSVFKKCKMYKIDLVLGFINENLKEILASVSNGEMDAEFVSQKMDSKGKKSIDKLDIIVRDNYKELPIDMVSGGQSMLVGIGCLLSVWKTARKLSNKACNCIFLDEVFGPWDAGTVNSVFDVLVQTAKELEASSVFIISHRDLDEKLFNNVLVAKMENGVTNLETRDDKAI